MRQVREGLNVIDRQGRVCGGLRPDEGCRRAERFLNGGEVTHVDKARLHPKLREEATHDSAGLSVESEGRDNVGA